MRVDSQFRVDLRSGARRLLAAAIKVFGSLPKTEYRLIVAEIVTALARQLPEDQVYPMSLGAFPAVVKTTLGGLTVSDCKARVPSRESSAHPAPWEHEEHDPVDAEWYFDVPSVERILSYFPPDTGSVVALGTPTVAAALAAAAVREVTLVDISQRFWRAEAPKWLDVSKVELIRHDLDEKVYDGMPDADVVVMDPPWYIENYRAWLKSAVAVCREGGLIAVALPQILTNRRSLPERDEIIRLLKSVGRVEVKYDVLTYVTPSFETAVLQTSGLDFLTRWRRADLALVKVRERSLPYEFRPFGGGGWNYREVYGQVVRTWGDVSCECTLPVIEPADPHHGYRLTAVGRNYMWSSSANLVTSRGRAATVGTWGALPRILNLAQAGQALDSAVVESLPHRPVSECQSLIYTLQTIFGC